MSMRKVVVTQDKPGDAGRLGKRPGQGFRERGDLAVGGSREAIDATQAQHRGAVFQEETGKGPTLMVRGQERGARQGKLHGERAPDQDGDTHLTEVIATGSEERVPALLIKLAGHRGNGAEGIGKLPVDTRLRDHNNVASKLEQNIQMVRQTSTIDSHDLKFGSGNGEHVLRIRGDNTAGVLVKLRTSLPFEEPAGLLHLTSELVNPSA
jgi:hypothetical protein